MDAEDQRWAESILKAVLAREKGTKDKRPPKRFATAIRKVTGDLSQTNKQRKAITMMARPGTEWEKRWRESQPNRMTPIHRLAKAAGEAATNKMKNLGGNLIDIAREKVKTTLKKSRPGDGSIRGAPPSMIIEEIDAAGNAVIVPDAEEGDVAHNVNPVAGREGKSPKSTAMQVLSSAAKGAIGGALVGAGEGSLAAAMAGAVGGAVTGVKTGAADAAGDLAVSFLESAKDVVGKMSESIGSGLEKRLVTASEMVTDSLLPAGVSESALAPTGEGALMPPHEMKQMQLTADWDEARLEGRAAWEKGVLDDQGKPVDVQVDYESKVGLRPDIDNAIDEFDYDDEFGDILGIEGPGGVEDSLDDGWGYGPETPEPTQAPTQAPKAQEGGEDSQEGGEDSKEDDTTTTTAGATAGPEGQRQRQQYIPNNDFNQQGGGMKLDQSSAVHKETQVSHNKQGGDVLQQGSESIDHSQATLRPRFGLAGQEDVIPTGRDQLASDLRFDLFSVVQPGFGEGRNNKVYNEEKFRENYVLPTGGFYAPNSWLGPLNTQHPLPWQWQHIKSNTKIDHYNALVQSRKRKGFRATLAVGEGSTQVLGRDYPELRSDVSSSGLQRDKRSMFEPSILTQDRMRPVIDPAGVALNQRGFRRNFEAWREPLMREHAWDEGGPTLKKRRALEVVLP
jgi:hypothetical protein